MTQRAQIAGILRQLPGLIGESLIARTRTSTVGTTPPTWSSEVSFTGQFSQEQEDVSHDGLRHTDVRRFVAVVIYPDSLTFALQGASTTNELPIGAEVKRADGAWWSVTKRLNATAGLKRALVSRELPRQVVANRGGRIP